MQQNKHIALTLGALVCAVVLMMTLGIGQTQARYDNTVSWEGIYFPEKQTLESNFLAEGGQLVLLSDWNVSMSSYRMVDIQLVSDSGAQAGSISCQVDSDLLTATVDQDSYTVGTIKNHAMLTLARTNKAAALEEKTTVTVRVSWVPEGTDPANSTVWADFAVDLLPDVNNTGADTAHRAYEAMSISHPDAFSWDEMLALKLTLPADADTVVLSYEGVQFPANTRCVIPGDAAYILGDEDMISVAVEGRQEITVLLDFSWTEEPMFRTSFFISAAAYADGVEFAIANANVSASMTAMQVTADPEGYLLKTDAQVLVEGDLEGFAYTVQQLTMTDGVLTYTDCQHLKVTTQITNNGEIEQIKLVISNDNHAAPAGTYRLVLQRIYDGVAVSSFEVPLFVCY